MEIKYKGFIIKLTKGHKKIKQYLPEQTETKFGESIITLPEEVFIAQVFDSNGIFRPGISDALKDKDKLITAVTSRIDLVLSLSGCGYPKQPKPI